MTDLSIVIPVYGCEGCLHTLHERLRVVTGEIVDEAEIVFVDDRSPDDSWAVLREIAARDAGVKLVRMSRNFGQHAAITAGLAQANGSRVVVMDCDLQDPPEHIPKLYAKAQEGFDVVLSKRRRRRGSVLRRLSGSAYYRLRNRLTGSEMHTNYTNLSLISRKVVDAFLALRDKDRQYLLIVDWLGYRRAETEVEHEPRLAGKSSYTWRSLARVAIDGMFFQSTVLLRWIVYAGFLLALLGVMLAAYTLIVYAFGRELPSWTGLPVLLLLLTGFMIVSTGVIGLYVGKIFDQVKGRPLYVIDTTIVDGVERSVPARLDSDETDVNGDARAIEAADPGTEVVPPSPR